MRFVKIPARTLLDGATGATEIHAADLAGLLSRYGVDLVAEGVESEALVADLLDYDLRLARGDLFSPSRPVRAEVMASQSRQSSGALAGASSAAPARAATPAGRTPPAASQAPVTLGQGALQGAIERLRKVQEDRGPGSAASQDRSASLRSAVSEPRQATPESPRRSAWRTLARRVGAPDRSA